MLKISVIIALLVLFHRNVFVFYQSIWYVKNGWNRTSFNMLVFVLSNSIRYCLCIHFPTLSHKNIVSKHKTFKSNLAFGWGCKIFQLHRCKLLISPQRMFWLSRTHIYVKAWIHFPSHILMHISFTYSKHQSISIFD